MKASLKLNGRHDNITRVVIVLYIICIHLICHYRREFKFAILIKKLGKPESLFLES